MYGYCPVNVSRAVGPRCVDRAIDNLSNNLSNDFDKFEPYNLRPKTTFYLLWFSRYGGFMNCHVTHMRVLIGSESSRAIMFSNVYSHVFSHVFDVYPRV